MIIGVPKEIKDNESRVGMRPVGVEALSQLVLKRPITVSDGSAAVTGLLLAFTCPPQTPLCMIGIGAFAAIFNTG
jgi:electron transport complex protein RnfD